MNSKDKVRLALPSSGLSGLDKKLVLTYDSMRFTDGVGAQLHRIYGIYSISRLLGVPYLHSPLHRVDYQGLSALERNLADPRFQHAFNDLFQIKSDVAPTDHFHKIRLIDISMDIVALFAAHRTDGRPTLVQLALPHQIADLFPDCYEVCKQISPFASSREGRFVRVAIHVRRGELFVLNSERMLPNGYYINVAQNVAQLLDELKIDYQMELHTEVPNKEFIVQPNHHGISHRISAPAIVAPELCRLDEFSVLPNLVLCINETAIECLRKLATADILIMSKSSFSYVSAILNRNGIVLYHPFWHHAPSSWITVGSDGQFDRVGLRRAVETLANGTASASKSAKTDERIQLARKPA